MLGAAIGSGVLRALAGLKIGLLVFLATWGFASGRGDWSNLAPFWTQRPGSAAAASGAGRGPDRGVHLARGLVGRQQARRRGPRPGPHHAAGPAPGPVDRHGALHRRQRGVPLPGRAGSDSDSDQGNAAFAALAGRALFGRAGEVAFAAIVVVSVAGSLAAVLMAFPRVYYAMARDGLFFPSFATVNPRRGTPARAVAFQATLAAVLALSGSFDQILGYFMVPTLAFLAMAVAAVFVLRRRLTAGADRAIAIPGYPVAPLLFLVPVLIVIVLQTLRDPLRAAIGLGVVAVGLPVSGLVLASQHRAAPPPAFDLRPRS